LKTEQNKPNMALHRTAIPLHYIAAGELGQMLVSAPMDARKAALF
jgi:hypothetical protein